MNDGVCARRFCAKPRSRGFAIALLIAAVACDTTAPSGAVSIVRASRLPLSATVAQSLSDGLQIQIRDARGNLNHGLPLEGVPFTVTVAPGSGTLTGTPSVTASGSTPIGVWTLGTLSGPNSLTVHTANGALLTIVATATASAPAFVTPVGETTATARGSVEAPFTPAVRVTDAYGNGVPGVAVTAMIGASSGTVGSLNPVTDSVGVASVRSWLLGPAQGPQTVTMAVQGLTSIVFTVNVETYGVDVRFVGNPPAAAIQSAFTAAAARIQMAITDGVSDVPLVSFSAANACGVPGLPVLNETIDDIVILAEVTPIDGVGNVLAEAGPCGMRASNGLPYLGVALFDSADVAGAIANGTFGSIVLHEFQHILGFGIVWTGSPPTPNLLSGTTGANPIFTGAAARAQYLGSGGTSSAGVPVEAGGGDGTALSHWRETVFLNELMTGYLTGTTQPYSAITIGSLADIGYKVAYTAADTYTVPAPGQLRASVSAVESMPAKEILFHPRGGLEQPGRTWAPFAAPKRDTVSITVRKPGRGQ